MRTSTILLLLYPIILLAQDPTSQQSNPPSSQEDLNAYLVDLAARNDTSIPFSLPGRYSLLLVRTPNELLNVATSGMFETTEYTQNLIDTCFQFDAVPEDSSHLYIRTNENSNAYYLELETSRFVPATDETFTEYNIEFSSKTPFAWKLIQESPGTFLLQADDSNLTDQICKPVFLYIDIEAPIGRPYFPLEPSNYGERANISDFQFGIVPCSFTITPELDPLLLSFSVESNKSVPLTVPGFYGISLPNVPDSSYFYRQSSKRNFYSGPDYLAGCFQINPASGDDTHVTIQDPLDPQMLYLYLKIDGSCSLDEIRAQAFGEDRECATDYTIEFGSILPFYWKLHQDNEGNFYLEADDSKIPAQEPRPFFLAGDYTEARPYCPKAPWVFTNYEGPIHSSQLQLSFESCSPPS